MPRDRVTKEKRAAAKAAKNAETAELKARLTAAVARMDMELEPPLAPSSVPVLTAVPAPTAVPATTDFPALNTVPAPIAADALEEEEADTALVVQEYAARFGGMSSLSLRPSHLVAYDKFMAAKASCALELLGIVDELSLRDIYALYPCNERPQYYVWALTRLPGVGEYARPEEHRCACGSSLRFMCKCESYPIYVVAYLEREQDGNSSGYGRDQNWQHYDEQERLRSPLMDDLYELDRCWKHCQKEEVAVWNDDGGSFWCEQQNCKCTEGCSLRRAAIKARNPVDLRVLQQEQDGVKQQLESVRRVPLPSNYTSWWEGFREHPVTPDVGSHQKTMHLADRLLRMYPGILKCDSARAMALYRRVSANDLIAACCDRSAERMLK